MPTSAAGISTNRRARGFTLIEILVVVVIIAIMAVGAVISLSTVGNDRGLEKESEKLRALLDYARDQAELQTREFGVRAFEGGYEFVVFDSQSGKWAQLSKDDTLRLRKLPEDLTITVRIEGRQIVLPKASDPSAEQIEDLVPQVMLFSSGEMNSFELFLLRPQSGKGRRIAANESDDSIEDAEMQPDAV